MWPLAEPFDLIKHQDKKTSFLLFLVQIQELYVAEGSVVGFLQQPATVASTYYFFSLSNIKEEPWRMLCFPPNNRSGI